MHSYLTKTDSNNLRSLQNIYLRSLYHVHVFLSVFHRHLAPDSRLKLLCVSIFMRLALSRHVINFETFVAKEHVPLSDLRETRDSHTVRRRSHAKEIWNRKRRSGKSRLNIWFAFAQTLRRRKKKLTPAVLDLNFCRFERAVRSSPNKNSIARKTFF